MKINSIKLTLRQDTRGSLVELIRPGYIKGTFKGQVILTTAKIGQTKGRHYHKRKTEWYCVIKGKGRLYLINNKTNLRKLKIMDGQKPELVEIPPNYFHYIKNIGEEEMYILVYIDEEFNQDDPDTYHKLTD